MEEGAGGEGGQGTEGTSKNLVTFQFMSRVRGPGWFFNYSLNYTSIYCFI